MAGDVSDECAGRTCPTGSVRHGCHCLMYVYKNVTWVQAVDHCANMTGKLVNIRSKRLQNDIKDFLKQQLGKAPTPSRGISTVIMIIMIFFYSAFPC